MKYFYIAALVLVLFSCEKKKTQAEKDDEIIREYLEKNNIDAIKHASGLYYLIEEEGNGTHITNENYIQAYYKGYYTDGYVFDSSTVNPADIVLSQTIMGWQIGIPLFDKGAKGTLFIPSGLAYRTGVIIFEIEVVDFW